LASRSGLQPRAQIVGAFLVGRRLSPHEFLGTAFWLGFSLKLLDAEVWIQTSHARA
jgi:hypothetical protein